jgi:CheY-like chemotaxis protein
MVLRVIDTGAGMDQATLARATEPFFTTKEQGQGTGLGLSMMQSVVAQSGGVSRLRSRVGVGTEVEIWLPRTDVAVSAVKDDVSPDPVQLEGGMILVCDDDPAVLEFLSDALNNHGYETVAVVSGRAALNALEADDSICMLIVDYSMPGMNGGLVVREVWDRYPDLPVLLITGNADPDAIQTSYPGLPMLRKPFDHIQLAARVRELLKELGVRA